MPGWICVAISAPCFRPAPAAPCTVTFLVGGVDSEYGDSQGFPAQTVCRLNEEWHRYTDRSGRL